MTRVTRNVEWWFGALGLALFSCAFPLHARADESSPSIEALAAQSDVVVLGTVVSVEAFARGPEGRPGIHTRVMVAVDEMLVGAPVSLVGFWVQGGQLDGLFRSVSGQARFAVGESVATFLFATADGALWPSGMAAGKWLRERNAGREVLRRVRTRGRQDQPFGPPMPRAEFVARVRGVQ